MEYRRNVNENMAAAAAWGWLKWTAPLILVAEGLLQWAAWWLRHRLSVRRPPGPRPLPIIGNILNMARAYSHGNLHWSLAHLARLHGRDLFFLQLGRIPTIVASTPSSAKHILSLHDSSLATRPFSSMNSAHILFYATASTSKSAFSSPYGHTWRFLRKFYASHMLNPQRIHHTHLPIIRHEIRHLLILHIYPNSVRFPHQVNLSSLFDTLLHNIFSRIVFGGRPSDISVATVDFYHHLHEVMDTLGVGLIAPFVPLLRFLDRANEEIIHRCHRTMDGILEDIIAGRRAQQKEEEEEEEIRDPQGGDSMLDILLASDPPLSRDQIKAMLLELNVAGIHTTATVLRWAMAEILSNERVMRRVQEEVDREVGMEKMVVDVMEEEEERGEYINCERLKYVKAVVKEVLRLHPPLPLLIPHMAMERCYVKLPKNNNGKVYRIDADTQVLVNAWAIARDEETWGPSASDFSPERFLQEFEEEAHPAHFASLDVRGQHFELIPFGSGRRICPGLGLAIPILELAIASLLHTFRWSPLASSAVDMSKDMGITDPQHSHLLASPLAFRLDHRLLN